MAEDAVSPVPASILSAAQMLYEACPDTFFTGIVENGQELTRPAAWDELFPSRREEFEKMADRMVANPTAFADDKISRACAALDKVMDSGDWKDWHAHLRDCVNAVAQELQG